MSQGLFWKIFPKKDFLLSYDVTMDDNWNESRGINRWRVGAPPISWQSSYLRPSTLCHFEPSTFASTHEMFTWWFILNYYPAWKVSYNKIMSFNYVIMLVDRITICEISNLSCHHYFYKIFVTIFFTKAIIYFTQVK